MTYRCCCLSFNVSGLLACVCCACRTQYDGLALHCLLSSQLRGISIYIYIYETRSVACACRSFETAERARISRLTGWRISTATACVCILHIEAVLSTRRHAAHPVQQCPCRFLPCREIQALVCWKLKVDG